MKRFSFSLQKLLDLREFREKQAELALGKAVSARDAIQLDLEDVGRKRVEATYSRQKGCTIQELLAIENYVNRLDKKKETLLEDLAVAELAVEKARGEYLVASRDRQVLSKLREKKVSAWHKENLNEEAATLDDISNSRYGKDDLI